MAARQPANAIGWLFLALGLSFVLSSSIAGYARLAVKGSLELPGLPFVAWMTLLLSSAGLGCLLGSVLLSPDGRAPGRRWRPLYWTLAALVAVSLVARAIRPGQLDPYDFASISNPLGVAGPLGTLSVAISDAQLPVFALGLVR